MNDSEERRFWKKVDVRYFNDCWEWRAGATGSGYGSFWVSGKRIGAHIVAHLIAHGPVPEGLQVMHSCDNKLCCNPRHLSSGTPKQNYDDMRAKGRAYYGGVPKKEVCKRGHPRTPENLRGRTCKVCDRETQRERERRKRHARSQPSC